MPDLPDDIESLKALIKRLWEENERLKAENADCFATLAMTLLRRRLGLDSSNSHKPPSSDGLKKKPIKPALPKEEGQSNGGQKGHEGKTLRRVENPDRIEVHLPSHCQCCGRGFSSADAHQIIGSRQVFDLPEPKLEVTEHRLGQVECCGVMQTGEYPAGVNAAVQYGPGVRALATLLSVDHKMPLEQKRHCERSEAISQLFEDLYGYDLNSAPVQESLVLQPC